MALTPKSLKTTFLVSLEPWWLIFFEYKQYAETPNFRH